MSDLQVISHVFTDWLSQDLRISMDKEMNGVESLNDLTISQQYDHMDFFDYNNLVAQKTLNHIGRNATWLEAALSEPLNDHAVGRLIFGGLKRASGTLKNAMRMQSRTQPEFLERNVGAHNIDPFINLVTEGVASTDFDSEFTQTSLNQLLAEVTLKDVDAYSKLYPIRSTLYYGRKNSLPVKRFNESALRWVQFSTACVAWAAQQRGGDLSSVPILEPKSICATPEPQAIYPFAA